MKRDAKKTLDAGRELDPVDREFTRRRLALVQQLRGGVHDVRADVRHVIGAYAGAHPWLFLVAGAAAGAFLTISGRRRHLAALAESAIRMAELGRLSLS